jgi:hypothetical protein
MKRILCLIGVTVSLALGLMPAAASADSYHFRSQNAYVYFDATEGCVSTWTSISFYESRERVSPGPSESGPALDIFVTRYDLCQHAYLNQFFAFEDLPADAISFVGGLQSARVKATVQAYDYVTGGTAPVSVDLALEGTGEPSRGSASNSTMGSGFWWISRWRGTHRDAVATGSVLLGATNLMTEPSTQAALSTAQSGIITLHSH